MPLTIEVANADALVKQVGTMIGHIGYFAGVEMPREMSRWQTEDMHRKKPATKLSRWRSHQKTVKTLVRPHSRYETERSKKYQTRVWRRLRRTKRVIYDRIQLRTSTRPILRPALEDRLWERMEAAFKETVTW